MTTLTWKLMVCILAIGHIVAQAAPAAPAKPADPKAPAVPKKPVVPKLTPKQKSQAEEDAYQKLSDEAKSKRCTSLRNQVECNKIRHCCYWEYEDPKYEEFLPMCLNYDVFDKFYVRDQKAYIQKLNQSSRRSSVNEGNLCDLLKFDERFPKIKRCSCVYMAKNNGSGLTKMFALAFVGVFALMMQM